MKQKEKNNQSCNVICQGWGGEKHLQMVLLFKESKKEWESKNLPLCLQNNPDELKQICHLAQICSLR